MPPPPNHFYFDLFFEPTVSLPMLPQDHSDLLLAGSYIRFGSFLRDKLIEKSLNRRYLKRLRCKLFQHKLPHLVFDLVFVCYVGRELSTLQRKASDQILLTRWGVSIA